MRSVAGDTTGIARYTEVILHVTATALHCPFLRASRALYSINPAAKKRRTAATPKDIPPRVSIPGLANDMTVASMPISAKKMARPT
jgi:hypothetical protein